MNFRFRVFDIGFEFLTLSLDGGQWYMDFGGNYEKWQRLSVNVVASATARWRPLMDCKCSRKMAGMGIWGKEFEF